MGELPDPAVTLGASAAVDERGARLWLRIGGGRYHELRLWNGDGSCLAKLDLRDARELGDGVRVVAYPRDVPGAVPLSPLTGYRYTLSGDGSHLLEGAFETAPPRGERAAEPFAFAVMSCHQPLGAGGDVDPDSLRMLQALPEVLRKERVKRVLMVGDQMYTDLPEDYSLFDSRYFSKVAPPGRHDILQCSAEEVRALLHARYRRSWGVAQFDAIQRMWPCHMIFDDHEFIDNWGSHPAHATPLWEAFGKGALDACYDYEMSRAVDDPAPPYHHAFDYGDVATFVMDLRSQKRTRGDTTTMFGPEQLVALQRFLEERARASVVMVVFSVPLFHLPDWLSGAASVLFPEGSDVHDRWSAPNARASRDALVRVLKAHRQAHPDQLMLLLGGDVHVSLASQLQWSEIDAPVYQFTASPLSNNEGSLKPKLAGLLSRLKSHFESEAEGGLADIDLLRGVGGCGQNPFADLNVGIVAFAPSDFGMEVTLKLYTFDRERPGSGKLVYRSEPLSVAKPG